MRQLVPLRIWPWARGRPPGAHGVAMLRTHSLGLDARSRCTSPPELLDLGVVNAWSAASCKQSSNRIRRPRPTAPRLSANWLEVVPNAIEACPSYWLTLCRPTAPAGAIQGDLGAAAARSDGACSGLPGPTSARLRLGSIWFKQVQQWWRTIPANQSAWRRSAPWLTSPPQPASRASGNTSAMGSRWPTSSEAPAGIPPRTAPGPQPDRLTVGRARRPAGISATRALRPDSSDCLRSHPGRP